MVRQKKVQILVTGGSGFLGCAIVEALVERHPEWSIAILDVRPPPDNIGKKVLFLRADITSAESVSNAFVDYSPDLVLHTAGIVPARRLRYSSKRKDWERVKAINYDGTKHVLDSSMAAGCRNFVYTSSCTVVIDDVNHDYFNMDENVPTGNATLHYGKSKAMAEAYVLSSQHADNGLVACALRPCTIIGPGDTTVMALFYDCIEKNETNFIVGDGDNFYDFMYIDNAVDAHILAAENLLTTKTAAGLAFFISNQEPVYFWDFLAYVWAQFGHAPTWRIYIPTSIAWLVGMILEIITWFTGREATLDRGSVQDGIGTRYSNNNRAKRILGYTPKVGIAEGVRLSCEAYKKHLADEATKTSDPKKTK